MLQTFTSRAIMNLAAHLDDIGKPAWIGLTIVSFILFWPLGLVVLGYLIGSGRMACWAHGNGDRWQRRMDRLADDFLRTELGVAYRLGDAEMLDLRVGKGLVDRVDRPARHTDLGQQL